LLQRPAVRVSETAADPALSFSFLLPLLVVLLRTLAAGISDQKGTWRWSIKSEQTIVPSPAVVLLLGIKSEVGSPAPGHGVGAVAGAVDTHTETWPNSGL
jgi:hypothetical protein